MKLSTKKVLKTILIVIVVFCLTVLIINTSPFDEELHPQVVELLKETPFPPVEGNAYFASLGLMEIHGKDITQTGYKITQYHIKNSENNSNGNRLTKDQYAEFFSVNSTLDLFWMVPIITCEMVYKYDCLSNNYDGFYEAGFNSKLNNERLQLLLSRYEKIIQMDNFIVYFDHALPSYSKLRKLGEIQLINKFKNHSSAEFIKQLYGDIRFWKMVLVQGDSIIDKMVALSLIRRDVLHLSEFLRVKEVKTNELAIINKILLPLSSLDSNLSKAFESEAKFIFTEVYKMEEQSSFFDNLFFQPNATNNYHYEVNLKPQQKESNLSLRQFIELRNQETPTSKLKPHYLYNFIGKTLIDYSVGNYSDYIARAHDTANMVKLVGIQLQAKLAKGRSITSILSMPENLNPYTDKPFEYNNEDGFSGFDCLDNFQECRVKFK